MLIFIKANKHCVYRYIRPHFTDLSKDRIAQIVRKLSKRESIDFIPLKEIGSGGNEGGHHTPTGYGAVPQREITLTNQRGGAHRMDSISERSAPLDPVELTPVNGATRAVPVSSTTNVIPLTASYSPLPQRGISPVSGESSTLSPGSKNESEGGLNSPQSPHSHASVLQPRQNMVAISSVPSHVQNNRHPLQQRLTESPLTDDVALEAVSLN
jgi:hypothetical protein